MLLLSIITWFAGIFNVNGQVKILGPECIVPGTEYQYIIDGNWPKESEITICVEGGVIAPTDTTCYKGRSIQYVRVIWNEAMNNSKISVTTPLEKGSLTIRPTRTLEGGKIDSVKIRSFKLSAAPATVKCSEPKGGGCTPSYMYQWEQSEDNLHWKTIEEATAQNLAFKKPLNCTLFIRRKVSEKLSNSIAYSDVILLVQDKSSKLTK